MDSRARPSAFAGRLASAAAAGLCLWAWLIAPATAQTVIEMGEAETDVLEQVDATLRRIIEVRGLTPQHAIPAGTHSRHTLREVLLSKIAEEMTPEEIRAEERVLRRLGVLGLEEDYYDLMLEILTAQIAGFYDEDTGELFLLDDLPAVVQAPTMAHELFHGVQDQLFGIERIRPEWDRADDALLAATALIEGDATGVMIDYAMGGTLSFTDIPNFLGLIEQQFGSWEEFASFGMPEDVPRFIQEQLLYPYLWGLSFIHFLKSSGGWAAVDQTYLDPPLSSEQILHPERYLDRDRPTWIELDLRPIQSLGYVVTYDQVFGEFLWGALFRDVLGDAVAERAIESASHGWDGDRMVALENTADVLVLIVLTVWDTPQDAREFEAVLRRFVEVRDHRETVLAGQGAFGSFSAVRIDDRWTVVERWGDMVLFVDGTPEDEAGERAADWRDLVWRGRRRSAYAPPAPAADPGPSEPLDPDT